MKLEPEKDHEPENVLVSFPYRLIIIIIFYYYVEAIPSFFYFLFKVFENLALFQEKAHSRVGTPCTNFEVSPSQTLNFGILS